MFEITIEQVRAAQSNDMDAVTSLITATDSLITREARRRASTGGRLDQDKADDYAQDGREALWLALKDFKGAGVDQFIAYITTCIRTAMGEAAHDNLAGLTPRAMRDFERALRAAEGDQHLAEYLATTKDVMGDRRMSKEAAHAARLAYQSTISTDASDDDGGTIADTLEDTSATTIMEMVAEQVGVPVDLLEPSDFGKAQSKVTVQRVRLVLDGMGERERIILSALTGVRNVDCYGATKSEYREEDLSADYGIPVKSIKETRSRAKVKFAAQYADRFAPWGEAEEWKSAAAAVRKGGK